MSTATVAAPFPLAFGDKPPTLEQAATRMYEAGAALRLAAEQLEGEVVLGHGPPPEDVLTMVYARARVASAVLWGIENWRTTYEGIMAKAFLEARYFDTYASGALLLETAAAAAIQDPMHPTTTVGGTRAGAVYGFACFHVAEFMIEWGERWTGVEDEPAHSEPRLRLERAEEPAHV